MKKLLKNSSLFCIVVLIFTTSRPRTVKAEALTLGGGLTYLAGAGASAASLPILIIGLAAVLLFRSCGHELGRYSSLWKCGG